MATRGLLCPRCGGTQIAVEVRTWCGFSEGEPDRFDDEDVPYVEEIPGGERICRACTHRWNDAVRASGREQAILRLAQEQRASDGDIDFDPDARVSEGEDHGAYVQAWVWIDFAGTRLGKERHSDEPKHSIEHRG